MDNSIPIPKEFIKIDKLAEFSVKKNFWE